MASNMSGFWVNRSSLPMSAFFILWALRVAIRQSPTAAAQTAISTGKAASHAVSICAAVSISTVSTPMGDGIDTGPVTSFTLEPRLESAEAIA